jgi:hypothetical protein
VEEHNRPGLSTRATDRKQARGSNLAGHRHKKLLFSSA